MAAEDMGLQRTAAAGPLTLTSSGQTFVNGDYTVLNNDWGTPQSLLNLATSQTTISIANTADAPNGVTMDWTFPNYTPQSYVWAYPEVFWGGQFGQTAPALTTTLDNLQTLDVTYSVSDVSANSDVLLEVWTTDDTGKQTNEIGVFVYGWGNGDTRPYSDGYITALENTDANGGGGGAGTWRFVTLRTVDAAGHPADQLSGTISFSKIIKDLISQGLVNPKDHITGLELGAEMSQGQGSMTVNQFSVYEALASTHLITDAGTKAGQLFDVTTNNDYAIDGGSLGAGTDVVRIGATEAATRLGVWSDGHISLTNPDYGSISINNVGSIEFSDQTVSVASLPTPTAGNDVLTTSAAAPEIHGGAGDDTITAGSAASYIRGDDGNDSIVGGSGFDDINGNRGDDTIDGGSGGGDWLVGGQGADLITSHGSDDVLYGNVGNDTLIGAGGNEVLRGGQDDDLIKGGSGNDWISGDRGADTIYGGAGADTFHASAGAGLDKVMDFNPAEGDRVLLDHGQTYSVSQVGADTVVDLGNGDQVVLVGVSKASLPDGWLLTS